MGRAHSLNQATSSFAFGTPIAKLSGTPAAGTSCYSPPLFETTSGSSPHSIKNKRHRRDSKHNQRAWFWHSDHRVNPTDMLRDARRSGVRVRRVVPEVIVVYCKERRVGRTRNKPPSTAIAGRTATIKILVVGGSRLIERHNELVGTGTLCRISEHGDHIFTPTLLAVQRVRTGRTDTRNHRIRTGRQMSRGAPSRFRYRALPI